ncbi:18713_t:CDS:1, partial [Racocetra persica]
LLTDNSNETYAPPPLYNDNYDLSMKVMLTYQELKNSKRNRINSLIYAYYLGELLSTTSTPLNTEITNHYHWASIRLYYLFGKLG